MRREIHTEAAFNTPHISLPSWHRRSSGLVLRPLRGTLRTLGSAHLELAAPQGRVEFTWRYVESTTGVWQRFEANVSLPAQLPKPVQLHIPLPANVRGGFEIRERNRVMWTSRVPSEMARPAKGVSVIATTQQQQQQQQQQHTVVLELEGVGSSRYQIVATRHP